MAYKPRPPRSGLREERSLLMNVKNGKAEAFDTFHEQHAAALFRLALAMAARPDAAVEIVEAAFRKAEIAYNQKGSEYKMLGTIRIPDPPGFKIIELNHDM